ncbi:MAG: hypothetical protein M3481_12710, partial [Actinomycetota bacterium]|nr:hypothetical protein [Actinomycetota bacterium]
YGCPAAGKTGTTDEGKDAWFVGYTPKMSTAVWVGYPDAGIAMPGAQGGTLAAPVWRAFMSPAQSDDCSDFALPETAFVASPFSGKYATGGTSGTDTYYPPTDDYTDTYTPPPTGYTDDPTDDSQLYEAPPQDVPPPAPEPAPVPINPPPGGGEVAPDQ